MESAYDTFSNLGVELLNIMLRLTAEKNLHLLSVVQLSLNLL